MNIRMFTVAALVLIAAGAGYIRLAPLQVDVWHVDPALAEKPAKPNHWLMNDQGDAATVVLPLPPETVAERLNDAALATPRTRVLAGGGLHVTYITRSLIWGFPDLTSIRITADGTGARVTVFARSRFGTSDFGVNKARVQAWLSQL